MRVAVLAGGRSSEHEVSLASAQAVRAGLEQAGHPVAWVEIDRDGVWRHEGAELAVAPGRGLLDVDVVFPVLHGPYGEDGVVQGLLESLRVPYVGSGVLASALCMDKVRFKELMARAGLPQVQYVALRAGRDGTGRAADSRERLRRLGLPVFVKPARLGSSVGIAKVAEAGELDAALAEAFVHDDSAIVEALAPGLEVECGILGLREPEVSVPGEIVIHAEWYDYEAKYTPGGMELVTPARIAPAVADRVREIAADAFVRAGCTGLARADFFVDGERVLLNELNTMPGFTQTSVFPKLWEASGVPFPALVDRLVSLALERYDADRALRH